ncbi:hypothetical protein [Achromobacter aloeverae]|uniref:Toxin CptA n=1 Tax=Achromobacter aloeverae TaxID=1750518 RepID=A0A4Q1HQ38_9BURK|nr:hypothetical protein [Achromobacter aloeverae]RXN93168.1 hypothetical protein C7R54_05535 [Achromobacter aloeverae]
MSAGEHSGWTLRVPVLRPRWVVLAEPVMRCLGGAAAACALCWLGLPAGSACLLALAAVAGAATSARARKPAVRALRYTADHALYVRQPWGWRPLALRAVARGWRCLALQGDLPAPLSPRVGPWRARRVSFTVWQDALPAPAWRRLSLLSHRNLRRARVRGRQAPRTPTAAGETGTA